MSVVIKANPKLMPDLKRAFVRQTNQIRSYREGQREEREATLNDLKRYVRKALPRR